MRAYAILFTLCHLVNIKSLVSERISKTAYIGEWFNLQCRLPEASSQYVWQKGWTTICQGPPDKVLFDNKRIYVSAPYPEMRVLVIQNVKKYDAGVYRCVVVSKTGSITTETEIKIKDRLDVEDPQFPFTKFIPTTTKRLTETNTASNTTSQTRSISTDKTTISTARNRSDTSATSLVFSSLSYTKISIVSSDHEYTTKIVQATFLRNNAASTKFLLCMTVSFCLLLFMIL